MMEIRLAHHYWKNGANATWNPVQFPFPEIEGEIKKDYVKLETDRPKWRKYKNITVIFDYRPGKDVYGRPIMPISFAFVPDCSNPELCYDLVYGKLARASVDELGTQVDIPQRYTHKKKKKFALALVCIFCVSFLISFSFNGEKVHHIVKDDAENAMPIEGTEVKVRENTESPIRDELSQEQLSETKDSETGEIGSVQAKTVEAPPLCTNIELAFILRPCPRKYFKAYCEQNLKKGESFAKWLAANPQICSSIERRSSEYFDTNTLRRDIKSKLKRLFDKGPAD